jgi:hypothetical protein
LLSGPGRRSSYLVNDSPPPGTSSVERKEALRRAEPRRERDFFLGSAASSAPGL